MRNVVKVLKILIGVLIVLSIEGCQSPVKEVIYAGNYGRSTPEYTEFTEYVKAHAEQKKQQEDASREQRIQEILYGSSSGSEGGSESGGLVE